MIQKLADDQKGDFMNLIHSSCPPQEALQSRPALSGEVTECSCGVPKFLHNTCCGWENASAIPINGVIPIAAEQRKSNWEAIKVAAIGLASLLKPQEPSQEAVRKAIEALENVRGVFDTPIARRKDDSLYAIETRKSVEEALELLKSTPPQEQRQGLSEEAVLDILYNKSLHIQDPIEMFKAAAKAICQLSAPTSEESDKIIGCPHCDNPDCESDHK